MTKRTALRHVGAGMAILGGIAVIVGSALPWVGIGGVDRSAFTLARVANEMNVFERRSQRLVVYALLSTPVLTPLGVLLFSVGWRRLCALSLFICGVIGSASGGVGTWASISTGSGPIVTALGGVSAVLGSSLLAACARSK